MNHTRTRYRIWIAWTAVLLTEISFWLMVAFVYFYGGRYLPTIRYHLPQYAWLMALLPLYSAWFIVAMYRKNRMIRNYSDASLVPFHIPQLSTVRPVIKYLLVRTALACITVALIAPKLGSRLEEVKSKGIDIMIALDVSNSMLAEDVSPNRLERARLSIQNLIEKLHGDRVGIVVFAGNAYVQLPITNDYGAALMYTRTIDTRSVTEQGTAIGNAIRLCSESFDPKSPAQKVIIVATDGEDHEAEAIEAARVVHEQGMLVYTLGFGTSEGTVIPIYQGERRTGFRQDADGRPVVTTLNEKLLAEIATAGGGTFTRVVNTVTGLSNILEQLNKMEKTEIEKKEFADYRHRFSLFAAMGMFFLVLDTMLASRKGKWTSYINVFE